MFFKLGKRHEKPNFCWIPGYRENCGYNLKYDIAHTVNIYGNYHSWDVKGRYAKIFLHEG